jgi:pyruvate,water dikinase
MLEAAQVGLVITEDHGYYIDTNGAHRLRQVLLEAGRRLAKARVIGHAQDVFMLTPEEIRTGLINPADLRPVVVERRAEMRRWAGESTPPAIGSLPPGPPPEDPMLRAFGKFFGMPPAPSEHPDELRGSAGSKGKVTGVARVIRSLTDAEVLSAGEILVAETTAPPWTPLFATAAAVVTDTGGILSHCAVVAREYGIPAVVGTGAATSAIQDGDTIEVDGDAGIVRIVRD